MDCDNIARLLSQSLDDEVSSSERKRIDDHLETCSPCRLEQEIWGKYERKLSHFYGSHRLDESFVARIREEINPLEMEPPQDPQPEVHGQVTALALRWLQPLGMAAGILLAVLLFALRSGPSVAGLIEGTGFVLRTGVARILELTVETPHQAQAGDLVWTNAAQRVRMQLSDSVLLHLEERGLLSLRPEQAGRDDLVAKLYSGTVSLGGGSGTAPFVVNTAAGLVSGEAGKVQIKARWVPMAEKRWNSGSRESWSEGWHAIPVTQVDVSEGRAEVASREGTRGLVSGQKTTVGATLPSIATAIDSGDSEVSVERLNAMPGPAEIRSRLLQGPTQVLRETTFVDVPLHTVLSSIAGVSASQIQLDSPRGHDPISLQVTRPVDTPAEQTLAAVAAFAGLDYKKEMRLQTTELLDLKPELQTTVAEVQTPHLALEVEGDAVRLLKGSGVPLSMLSLALEDPWGRKVEPGAADWTLEAFEIRDIPRDRIAEILTRELPIRFRAEDRLSPHYRLQVLGEVKEVPGPTQGSGEGPPDSEAPARGTSDGGTSSPEANRKEISRGGDAPLRGRNPSVGRAAYPEDHSAGGYVASDPAMPTSFISHYEGISSWFTHLAAPRPGRPFGALGRGLGFYESLPIDASAAVGEIQFQSVAQNTSGSATPAPPDTLWTRISLRVLRQWSVSSPESKRLIFTALPRSHAQDASDPAFDLVLFGFSNRTEETAWVRADLRDQTGELLDRTYVEVLPRSITTAAGSDLFPQSESGQLPAYVETESALPVAGFQITLRNQGLAFIPAQIPSNHREYFTAPMAFAGVNSKTEGVLKLVNPTDVSLLIRISWLDSDNDWHENLAETVIGARQSAELGLAEILEAAGGRQETSIRGSLWLESDHPGLVGHVWTGKEMGRTRVPVALPLSKGLRSAWNLARFSLGSSLYEDARGLGLALVNPHRHGVTVRVEFWSAESVLRVLDAVEVPGRGKTLVALPEALQGVDYRILVSAASPIGATLF